MKGRKFRATRLAENRATFHQHDRSLLKLWGVVRKSSPSHAFEESMAQHQIFSLDITELSDQLNVSELELLAGLNGNDARFKSNRFKRASIAQVPLTESFDQNNYQYAVCLVVSEKSALEQIQNKAFSVLELSLRRLFVHPPCDRILVCVTDGSLTDEVEAIVRACERCALALTTVGSTIDVLHGDQDEVSAVRHACMYVDASSSPLSRTAPLVIIRAINRVFEVKAIDELVRQLQNAAVQTNGLTRAVALVDSATREAAGCADHPVGIWVCFTAALLEHCDVADHDEHNGDATMEKWLPSMLGSLYCENIIASAEFNWEESSKDGKTLAHRFEPLFLEQRHVSDYWGRSPGSTSVEVLDPPSSGLSIIRTELDGDGVKAALFAVPTTLAREPSTNMAPNSGKTMDENTPLLSTSSRVSDATVLSEVDMETPDMIGANALAYLIQVERSGPSEAPSATPELVLALPDDVTEVLENFDTSDEEDTSMPAMLRKRADSDLPSDITQVTLEAVVLPPKIQRGGRRVSVLLHVQREVPVVGYLILVTALFAVSSQGAVLDLLVGVPPLLKLFWRVSGVALALFPFAVISMCRKGLPRLGPDKKMLALVCVLSYATYNSAFLVALSLTSIGHVYIFANSHSLIMVAGKLLLRQPLLAMELLGAALGFGGGVLTTTDHGPTESPPTQGNAPAGVELSQPSLHGDLVAFAGAFAGVSYLLCAKRLRAALGVRVFLFLLATGVALVLLPILVANHERLGIDLAEPTHAQRGLLGWVHHLDIEASIVLVGSVCGTMGFIAALKYFDPLVVSVTMLTEPVVATVLSIFVGVERVPGWPTLVGGLAVISGCLLVLLSTHHTSAKIDVSDQLVKTQFTSAVDVLRDDEALERRRRKTSMRRATYGTLA